MTIKLKIPLLRGQYKILKLFEMKYLLLKVYLNMPIYVCIKEWVWIISFIEDNEVFY